MTDIVIHPLSFADAAQWRELRLEALRDYQTAFANAYEEALAQDLSARIPSSDSPSVLFGAFVGGMLSGSEGLYVSPAMKQRHKTELWGMYVAPSLHRSGVGSALLRAVIDHARTRVAMVQLTVPRSNGAAKALYSRFAFVSYGIEKRALRHQGVDHDDELMALDLGNGL